MSARVARRIALGATGLARPRPSGRLDRRHLRGVVERLGVLQLDSVNVLTRAHYLPVWSRLGAYDRAALDGLAWRRGTAGRELFEYWGHEASLLPVDLQPLLRWRMERGRRGETWGSLTRHAREHPDQVAAVLDAVRGLGPVRVADVAAALGVRGDGTGRAGSGAGSWWERGDVKLALEWLFWIGEVTTAGRVHFERRYDVPERVLPARVLAAPTPPEDEAQRALLARAARALGVGTARDLADYYRIRIGDARARLPELAEEGVIVPVAVEGWRETAYLDPAAERPRTRAAALLAPFDPLVWERSRARRLFGFDYRIEIYVPADRRVHGYYVLPFLLGDALVARVDLKADRSAGVLRVRAAHAEPGIDAVGVAAALAAEVRDLATWSGLDDVEVERRGDLAEPLAAAARRA